MSMSKIRFDGMEYDANRNLYILNEKVGLQPVLDKKNPNRHSGVRVVDLNDPSKTGEYSVGLIALGAHLHGFEYSHTTRGSIKGTVVLLSICLGIAAAIGFGKKGPIENGPLRRLTAIGVGIVTFVVPNEIAERAVEGMDDGYDYVISKPPVPADPKPEQ